MKKNYYLLQALFLFLSISVFAQSPANGCGSILSTQENEAFIKATQKMLVKSKLKAKGETPADPYIVPVVFHILHNGNGAVSQADMKCRIDDVMLTVNGDFNGTFDGYINGIDPRFDAIKDKMNIQFVLATVDPYGNTMATPGMNWQAQENIAFGYDTKIYDHMWWGINNKYYLDIVIVDAPNAEGETSGSGHAFLPTQNVVPHVTYNWRYVGSTCGSFSSNGFEKVMTHEFGHYFGLKHTFQDDCDPVNDGISDTPPTTQAEGCTRDVLNNCGVYANLENHMDYNTSCQNMFTREQVSVMTAWLDDTSIATYQRSKLWSDANLSSVGITQAAPVADFSANTRSICPGASIDFKDMSLGLPTSLSWSFQGGAPATATTEQVTVTYANAGVYKVTLVATNAQGTNTTEMVDYIEVGQKNTLAISEDFSGSFPPQSWDIDNPDVKFAWEKRTDAGNGDTSCMVMNNSDNSVVGELDAIRLPFYDFTSSASAQLYFDVAYTKFDNASADVLKVQVSTDCGTTWVDAYSKTHTELQTKDIPTTLSNDWVPTTATDWRREIVDLSTYDGNADVAIRFLNTSGYGTRIWIDNVNVVLQNAVVPESDFSASTTQSNCSSTSISFYDTSIANPTSWSWSFPGATPSSATVQNPVVVYDTPGVYAVTLVASNAYGSGSTQTKTDYITIASPILTDFTQDFEGVFPPQGWQISNLDAGLTWEKRADVGNASSSCMIMNNSDNETIGEVDEIILAPLNLSVGATSFSFDVAYTKYDNDSPDKLSVLASKDCGVTWQTVYFKTHTDLETVEVLDDASTWINEVNNWVPTQASHWRKETVNLSAFQAESNVLIKFKNESGYGTRIFIDNIAFDFDSNAVPVTDFEKTTAGSCIDLPITFTDTSANSPTSWTWSFPGATPSTSTAQNPVVVYNTPGDYNVTLTTSNTFGSGNTVTKSAIVTIKSKGSLPLNQDFSGAFPVAGWEVLNPDADAIAWEKRFDAGNGDSSCMVINNADNETLGAVDEVLLESIDFSTADNPVFTFDVAYTKYNSSYDPDIDSPDKLTVLASKDCGATWQTVYFKTHTDLETVVVTDDPATTDANEANDWIPTNSSDWRKETVDLSSFKNESTVLIKFKNESGYGTRIWIDNIAIENQAVLSNTSIENPIGLRAYPNPSTKGVTLTLFRPNTTYTIALYNILGQRVYQSSFTTEVSSSRYFDFSDQRSGVYFIHVTSLDKKIFVEKWIKQ